MKHRILSFLLVLLLIHCIFLSHAQDVRFSKVYYNTDDWMHLVASAEAGKDSLMMISIGAVHLMDGAGAVHWSKSLVKEGSWIKPMDIVRTADQNFIICASEYTYATDKYSVLLIKLNIMGDLIWVKKIDHEVNAFPSGIILSSVGDIIVTGHTRQGIPLYQFKLLLMRFTTDGALLWARTYETDALKDEGVAVAELANGQLIIGGQTKGSNFYNVELSLTQTDADGNILWAKREISPVDYNNSQVKDIVAGPLGFYLSYADTPQEQQRVMSFNPDGEIIWSKSLYVWAFIWEYKEYRGRINTTSGGDLLLSFGSKWWGGGMLSQITTDGSVVWSQDVYMHSMEVNPLSDGGYLFLGIGPMTNLKMEHKHQSGVIRTNAMGEGLDCMGQRNLNLEDYIPTFTNLTYTAVTDVGSTIDYALQWEEFPLDSFMGCVDFIGAVGETPDVANALKIYPNPGNGPFRLMLEDMQPESVVQLSVYNSKGQNIYSREGDWSRLQVINHKLPAGLYLINVKTPKRVFTTRLIVK